MLSGSFWYSDFSLSQLRAAPNPLKALALTQLKILPHLDRLLQHLDDTHGQHSSGTHSQTRTLTHTHTHTHTHTRTHTHTPTHTHVHAHTHTHTHHSSLWLYF